MSRECSSRNITYKLDVLLLLSLSRYLVNFLLDSTIGLLLIYVLLKLVSKAVTHYRITALISGEYGMKHWLTVIIIIVTLLCLGDPFQFRYWLAQCAVYLVVMLLEKIFVGPLILFRFWTKVSDHVCVKPAHPMTSRLKRYYLEM